MIKRFKNLTADQQIKIIQTATTALCLITGLIAILVMKGVL